MNGGRVRLRARRALLAAGAALIVLLVPTGSASAHPLGNFSVNHLSRIEFERDSIRVDVVVDAAEIPTAQDRPIVDVDGDGEISSTEAAEHARNECAAFVEVASMTLDGAARDLSIDDSSFAYAPGQAGLETSRLECTLSTPVADGFDVSRTVVFDDGYRPGRVGWHEINAVGVGAGIIDSPVPTTSVTNDLRVYPADLLQSPLDVRSVTLQVGPGGVVADNSDAAAADGSSAETSLDPDAGTATAADARDSLIASRPGFFGSLVDGVQNRFDDMIGRQDLTLGVGLLAIGLAMLLGASHAVLPGHGKTVMAAYIAGRQGSVRDAALVGATVTLTHTGGVLLLGLGLTLSAALAGETVLAWLGVASGLLIAGLGIALVISATRRRNDGWLGHGHSHGPGGHTHGPGEPAHAHEHGDHEHGDHEHGDHEHGDHEHADHEHGDHEHASVRADVVHAHAGHDDPHGDHAHQARASVDVAHLHEDRADGDHGHGRVDVVHVDEDHAHDAHDSHGDHAHGDHALDGHTHDGHDHEPERVSRRGLVGMGVAGGLVPSPSALIVLLSAIALGRTWFGIVLVVGYGAGMAIVLTMAGILLVKVRDRLQDRIARADGRVARNARRWGRLAPFLTASLVVVVGLGLAIRSIVLL